jgi:hypothetical protein
MTKKFVLAKDGGTTVDESGAGSHHFYLEIRVELA